MNLAQKFLRQIGADTKAKITKATTVLDGVVSSRNPDGTVNVTRPDGSCVTVMPRQNVRVGESVKIGLTPPIGQLTNLTTDFYAQPGSSKPGPADFVCDLSPGGAPPDPPLLLVAYVDTGIWLGWGIPPCAVKFNVERGDGACGDANPFVRIASNVTGQEFIDTAAAPDQPYKYRVTCIGKNGSESEPSDCVDIAVIDAPATMGAEYVP
jgi:hypothetical protein